MRFRSFSSVAALGVIGLASLPALGDEDSIDLAKVPAVVKQAANRAVPGARWSRASRETDDGKTLYELTGTTDRGRAVDVAVTTEGTVTEVETEVPLADVPAAVTAALKDKQPKFRPESAESVMKNGKIVAYEFEGDGPDGKDMEVSVSADGRTVKVDND